jgi:hypothetical protein
VICHAQSSLMWDLGETQGTVALRVPDHENTRELLSRTGPLAVSSANLSGQPATTEVYDAEAQLRDSVAVYLDGGPAGGNEPSTIVDLTGDTPYVVRVGALSLDRLREVVPEITSALDPEHTDEPQPVSDDVKPTDEAVPEDGKPTDETVSDKDETVSDRSVSDKAVGDEPVGEDESAEKPAEDKSPEAKSGEAKPAEAKSGRAKPAEAKPAD